MDNEMTNTSCSCGCKEDHVIARGKTADNVAVKLWSNGDITSLLGSFPRGLAGLRNRRAYNVQAGWTVLGDVSLYTWAELATVIRIARRECAAARPGTASYIRSMMASCSP